MTTISNTDLSPLPAGQFRIYRREGQYAQRSRAENARLFQVGDYVVECDELLRVSSLKDEHNNIQGLVLGYAFVAASTEPLSSRHFTDFFSSTDQAHSLELLFEQLFGAFILILNVDGKTYVYLDADGCLSAVYSQELDIVGSTAAALLAPGEYESRFRRDLYARLDVAHEGWFPSGLTAHHGVSRLLCNHRLDLDDLSAERHWPTIAPVRSSNKDASLNELAAATRDNLNCVFTNFRPALALSGGADSRALLSLSRHRREQITTYVVNPGTTNEDMDVCVSSEVARRAGIKHKLVSPLPDDPAIEKRWHFRGGHAMGGNIARTHTALSHLTDFDTVIEGFGAEVARHFFWRSADTADMVVTGEMIVQRFGMPVEQELVAATDKWLEHVPRGDAFFVLDLAYLELRSSAWCYAQSYADPSLLHFSPFISRRAFKAMFEMPLSVKNGLPFSKEFVLANWPELASIPYNRFGDYRDLIRVGRKLTKLHLIQKKLRKVLAR